MDAKLTNHSEALAQVCSRTHRQEIEFEHHATTLTCLQSAKKNLELNSELGMVAHACHVSTQRLKQEEYCEFKVNLGYIVRLCPTKENKGLTLG